MRPEGQMSWGRSGMGAWREVGVGVDGGAPLPELVIPQGLGRGSALGGVTLTGCGHRM